MSQTYFRLSEKHVTHSLNYCGRDIFSCFLLGVWRDICLNKKLVLSDGVEYRTAEVAYLAATGRFVATSFRGD